MFLQHAHLPGCPVGVPPRQVRERTGGTVCGGREVGAAPAGVGARPTGGGAPIRGDDWP